MSTYGKANRTAQWYSNKYGSTIFKPNCVVWHSTETFSWPGYGGGAMAPNYTVMPDMANKKLLWRAHFEDEESSRALVNLQGGVDTNTANAIQVEMIGTCNPAWGSKWPKTSKTGGKDYLYLPDAPEWYLKELADFVQYLNKKHGIRMQSGLQWLNYGVDARRPGIVPASYGKSPARMSFDQWREFYGHCGHQHVPENNHGDPGYFPMEKVLNFAKGSTPSLPTKPATVKDDFDMTPAERTKFINDIAKAVASAVHNQPVGGAKLENGKPRNFAVTIDRTLSGVNQIIKMLDEAVEDGPDATK